MFRHPVHPQAIARVQAIKYLQRQPTYRRSFSADSKPEQEDRGGDEGSTLKKRLVLYAVLLIATDSTNEYYDKWDRVFENDKPLADLRKVSFFLSHIYVWSGPQSAYSSHRN